MTKMYKVTAMMEDGETFNVYVEATNKKNAKAMVESDGIKAIAVSC